MKALKIVLVVATLIAIGIIVYRYMIKIPPPPPPPPPPVNLFVSQIETEIESLQKILVHEFSSGLYHKIEYHIADGYKNALLGKNANENNQWKDILSKNLYVTYSSKFINQAFYVFKNSEWDITSLSFIKTETIELQRSSFLQKSSTVDNSFNEIHNILIKYYEINNFINSCRNFTYSGIKLQDSFPINQVKFKIQTANNYISNQFDNKYVNNCTRLHDEIKNVPAFLFQSHVKYLSGRIQNWSGKYSNFNSHSDYTINLFIVVKHELEQLDNGVYNIDSKIFDTQYSALIQRWNSDNVSAYAYFSNRITN